MLGKRRMILTVIAGLCSSSWLLAQSPVLPGPTSSSSSATSPARPEGLPSPIPTTVRPFTPAAPDYQSLGGVDGSFSLYPLRPTSPIMMTSINYPGVYGAYYYGAAPQAWTQGVSAAPMTLRPSWTTLPPSVAIAHGSPLYGPPVWSIPVKTTGAAASITIHTPEGASVWVQDQALVGTAPRFVYTTPLLRSNQLYRYEVRAAWSQDGQPVTDSQTVTLQAGERHVIGFSEKKLINGKP